ncbi:response regulator [Nitratidesulfovibrio vulgaris]|uniref:response regulator n=1 Tax=Nitratidesulfovibrio vulgaris TaxID=881 RepID=UPI002301E148|nr:response regulator [Nitratidesulfovibrio vulgaris]WCB47619.1 response regulator [Nitratidesulfovibrio vulgaris]
MTTHTHTFTSALIMTRREACAAVDRQCLRAAGIQHIRVLTSGRDAARWLIAPAKPRQPHTPPRPDVIVCDARLADMSGLDFIRLIRQHRRLAWIPVVFITPSPTEDAVLEAVGAGCSAVVARPYPLEVLHRQLRRAAASIAPGNALRTAARTGVQLLGDAEFEAGIAALDDAVGLSEVQAVEAYRHAMRHLIDREWDKAIAGFNRALRHNEIKGDAQLGLSAAWRGKGDLVRSRAYLRAASQTFARAAQWQRARQTLADLMREAPESGNALFEEASRLIRAGDFDSAAHALLMGRGIGEDTQMIRHVARASQFTPAPQRAIAGVCKALARSGATDIAKDLHRRLGGIPEATAAPEADAGSSFLARFPLLHDVLAVARYTLRVWRSAA